MIQWIKLHTNIFENEKIICLFTKKNGSAAFKIYIQLLCLAGTLNNGGVFKFESGKPMTITSLSAYLRTGYHTLFRILKLLCELNLLAQDENGSYVIPNWDYHQNSDALRKMRDAERKRKARAKKKLEAARAQLEESEAQNDKKRPRTRPQKSGTSPHTEKDREEEKEKDLVFLSDDRKTGQSADALGHLSGSDTQTKDRFETDGLEADEYDEYELEQIKAEKRAYEQENTKWRNSAEYVSAHGHGLVKMTQRQYEDLLERMDPEVLDDYIDKLGAYLEKNGRRSTRAYKVILDWFYKDIAVDPSKDFIKAL